MNTSIHTSELAGAAERYQDTSGLLCRLIRTSSFSREEAATADIIDGFLRSKNITTHRFLNNVWALNAHFDPAKPSILLNSHHDTVHPNKGYTKDPFSAEEKDGKLYGLGSNDAGGALTGLIQAFCFYHPQKNLPYNLVIAATAEEEISGKNGVEALLQHDAFIQSTHHAFGDEGRNGSFGIVGEPTLLNMAVAERGLLVLDCTAQGKAGHAAREEGDNAIYRAMTDIDWFRRFQFEKVSPLLGPVKMTVTMIQAGEQHNVVPHECRFTVDIRVNELYTFEEVLQRIRSNVSCFAEPRSIRLRPTSISVDHPIVQAGLRLQRSHYGSPTTSDKALMTFPALKIGPGDSARSHTADEYIYTDEIRGGTEFYILLLQELFGSRITKPM